MHHQIENDIKFLVSKGGYHDFERFVLQYHNPSADELCLIAQALLDLSLPVDLPNNTIDVCGTGGDMKIKTTNISTISTFVLAKKGVRVVKHCGRAVSSLSGSSDFLSFFDIGNIAPSESLRQNGYCFIQAADYHPAYRYIAPFRRQYGKPTVFNMLGPMINPAKPKYRMIGTSFHNLLEYAKACDKMGYVGAIVQSQSGCDELLSFEKNTVVEFGSGKIHEYTLYPKDYNIPMECDDSIVGRTPKENFENAVSFLQNPQKNTLFYTVALNCALASKIYGTVGSLQEYLHSMI